ncbi:hypothetical protein FRC06_005172 [Ceratobasidium sp. 370]|nr:hypothetical protein FRC06_005172 [Ceratobasidium sp. 370]
MALPEALESRFTRLRERLGKFVDNPIPEDTELDDRAYKSREKKFLKIFSDTCALVREQTSNQSPHLSEIVENAQGILNEGVEYAYGDSQMFDFLPSWAHDDAAGQPLVKDHSEARPPVPASALLELLQILQVPSSSLNMKEMTPDPWKNTVKRHPKSSPLARFRPKVPALTPTAANLLAMSVYDARCEVQSTRISSPIDLHLSQGNACLALNAMDGEEVIGEDDDDMLENTWRDDPEEIETSSGSPATTRVKFADQPDLSLTRWRPLVHAPSTMLCHSDPYDCFTIDLEHEGRVTSRYLGHGGKIADLSVSGGDPQVFLTACSDGYARLFDLRTPLPVLTLDACQQSEYCDAAVLAHPDGIPTVFTGTGRAEQIKMWDVRARTTVYELATGNNRVVSLAWDSTRNYLYAATECIYQDRMGYRHDYRRAKISTREDREDDDEDMDEDEDEADFDDFDERSWPKNAWHDENYFGYAFDAGDHRIYRYAFKENPDISVVPEYGDASVNESSSFW